MMLRVRPAQCTTMVAWGSGARSAMCRATSPLGAAAAAGNGGPSVLLRRTRVEEDDLLPPLLESVQLLRVHLGHLVHDLDLLAEVLAGDVHPPLRRMAVRRPPVDAAFEHGHPAKSHPLEGGGGEGCPPAIVVADDHPGARERHETRHPVLELAAGHEACAGNMRIVVLARLAHVDEGAGALRVEQRFESSRGHLLRHVWFGSSAMGSGRPPRGDEGLGLRRGLYSRETPSSSHSRKRANIDKRQLDTQNGRTDAPRRIPRARQFLRPADPQFALRLPWPPLGARRRRPTDRAAGRDTPRGQVKEESQFDEMISRAGDLSPADSA